MLLFSDLWEESEALSFSENNSVDKIYSKLELCINQLKISNSPILMGEILYYMSFLSRVYDINVYQALLQEIQGRKIDLLES